MSLHSCGFNNYFSLFAPPCMQLFAVLATKKIVSTDGLRRAVESLSPAQYRNFGYYEKWSAALAQLLQEAGARFFIIAATPLITSCTRVHIRCRLLAHVRAIVQLKIVQLKILWRRFTVGSMTPHHHRYRHPRARRARADHLWRRAVLNDGLPTAATLCSWRRRESPILKWPRHWMATPPPPHTRVYFWLHGSSGACLWKTRRSIGAGIWLC